MSPKCSEHSNLNEKRSGLGWFSACLVLYDGEIELLEYINNTISLKRGQTKQSNGALTILSIIKEKKKMLPSDETYTLTLTQLFNQDMKYPWIFGITQPKQTTIKLAETSRKLFCVRTSGCIE